MRNFITFVYRVSLMGFMILGVFYLAELLPFQNDEDENTSEEVVAEMDTQEDVVVENEENNEEAAVITNEVAQEETLAPDETTEASEIATVEEPEQMQATTSVSTVTPIPTVTPTATPMPTPTATPTPIPEPTDREVLQLISDSVVTNSEGYEVTFGDAYNVFAEQTSDVFSFRTLVWYNMWGHNIQDVCFNAQKLTALGDIFCFKAGLEDGGSGTVTLSIYLDGDTENPAYQYTLDASLPPVDVSVDIRDASSMKIVVENHAGDQNRIVCYDFDFVNEEEELV